MKLTLLLSLLFIASFLSAQDQIILQNGEQIPARVLEVGQDIRYKVADHLDGPTYVVPRADVAMIRYANGQTDEFPSSSTSITLTETYSIRQQYLRIQGWQYYEGSRLISHQEFKALLGQEPMIYQKYESGRQLMWSGMAVFGVGTVISLGAAIKDHNEFKNNFGNSTVPEKNNGLIIGGAGLALVGLIVGGSGVLRANKAINDYNILKGKDLSVKSHWSADGIGLTLHF